MADIHTTWDERKSGCRIERDYTVRSRTVTTTTVAEWAVVRDDKDRPEAEIFHVAYLENTGAVTVETTSEAASGSSDGDRRPSTTAAGNPAGGRLSNDTRRPVTFLVNGGPGAASAFLHLGAVGPKRVRFQSDGTTPASPVELVDNDQSWLPFTDLVFMDTVDTGFSRAICNPRGGNRPTSTSPTVEATAQGTAHPSSRPDNAQSDAAAANEPTSAQRNTPSICDDDNTPHPHFGLQRDLDTLCRFIADFLSRHNKWGNPVFIAGESYGGFRAAKLARLAQEKYGIGLSGVIMISPALEFGEFSGTDYNVLPWIDRFPVMAATADYHMSRDGTRFDEKTTRIDEQTTGDRDTFLADAEHFASRDLSHLLISGDSLAEKRRKQILNRTAKLTGLSPTLVTRSGGRIPAATFARELLKETNRIVGMYDGSITAEDPFPDRDTFEGGDPTLWGMTRVFASGINLWLREHLGVSTTRSYKLLNSDVGKSWKIDFDTHILDAGVGAGDDLRYGLTLNPHMGVFVIHGVFDLVTPYTTSKRILSNMKLTREMNSRVTFRTVSGGHMFYTWDVSRAELRKEAEHFVERFGLAR